MSGVGRAVRLILQLVGALAILGGLLAVAVLGAVSLLSLAGGVRSVPRHTVLTLDLETPPVEARPTDPLSQLLMGPSRPTVRDIVEALDQAGSDDRIEGLFLTLGGQGGGMAVAQEIRDAIRAFNDDGKFTIAFAETFGEASGGIGGYYVATACDEIVMQPSGDAGVNGLAYETLFLRGLFDKLELDPRFDQRKQYKNAMNTYTETGYTAPHREALTALMDAQFDQIVAGIADGRALQPQAVEQLIDEGPFFGGEAYDAGLIDQLAYRDEARERARRKAGSGARFVPLADYVAREGTSRGSGPTIALIYGVGTVMRGESLYNPLTSEPVLGSDTVAGAFRSAVEDDAVKAIVFRVDSPGGSYVASDTIWRETVRARKAGKPVIVSMGNVAGSGGYFVAMDAEKIVAQPGTVTGSIGVFGGKVVTADFLEEKLGVTTDEVHTSDNALMFSTTQDYSASAWDRHQDWLDRVYDDFTSKVAEGRRLDKGDVLQIAGGRIWSGSDALERGLVDELGGFPTAFRLAKEAADIDADARVRVRVFPKAPTLIEMLLEDGGGWGIGATGRGVRSTLEGLRGAARTLEALGLMPADDGGPTLMMTDVPVVP